MFSPELKRKAFWAASSIGYLALAYKLTRDTFFNLHGMIEFTNIITLVSVAVILIVSLLGRRIPAIGTVIAYIGGFAIAMMFKTDGIDLGGGKTNNAWIIWTISYVLILLIGFIIDYIIHKRGKEHATADSKK